MTLRTIESEFSEILLSEAKEETVFDLTMDGPLFSRQHPKVIWATLQFRDNPEQELNLPVISGWFYDCFANISDTEKKYPSVKITFIARPWTVSEFLEGEFEQGIMDFGPMGAIYLSRKEFKPEPTKSVHWHTLPIILNYALSPELWGPQGKWKRFHERLQEKFGRHNLLNSEAFPGYYPLKSEASKLWAHGFQGTNLEKSYLLVLPWTFSLTALEKLEKVIEQEF